MLKSVTKEINGQLVTIIALEDSNINPKDEPMIEDCIEVKVPKKGKKKNV